MPPIPPAAGAIPPEPIPVGEAPAPSAEGAAVELGHIRGWASFDAPELQHVHGRLCAATAASALETPAPPIDHAHWRGRGPPTAADLDPVPAAFATPSAAARAAALRRYHAAQRAGRSVPVPLGDEQLAALRGVYRAIRLVGWYQSWGLASQTPRATYTTQAAAHAAQLELPMAYILQGAPGTGKTALLHSLRVWMQQEQLGEVAYSAYTGVAVTGLPAPAATYCTFFGIGGAASAKALAPVQQKQRETFAHILGGRPERLSALVLDEFSFLSVPQIAHLDQRLRELLDSPEPFGGVVLVLVGDSHQLPSVGGMGLHTALVIDALGPVRAAELGFSVQHTASDPSHPHTRGLALLRAAHRLPILQTQQRTDDPAHQRLLAALRRTDPHQPPVGDAEVDALRPLTAAAVAEAGDALRFARIGVLGNRERHTLNRRQARAFALRYARVVIQWRLELVGQSAGWLSSAEKAELYEHEDGLWGTFVRGAPAIINYNVGTDRGLVNGVSTHPWPAAALHLAPSRCPPPNPPTPPPPLRQGATPRCIPLPCRTRWT